jgi:beta-lactamase class A
MRRTPVRAPSRLAIYPLAVALVMLLGGVAYASPGMSVVPVVPIAVATRQPGQLAQSLPSPKPAPPVTTVLASSALDGLRSDLGAIAARSGGRVSISLQELSGPRRTSISLDGNRSFYAASTYKLPLLMVEGQQIASGLARASDVLCFDPSDAEDGWFTDYGPGSCYTRDVLALRTGRYSDNTAAHILVRYLGGPDALNRYAKSIGMSASALWIPNTTTPDDLTAAWVNEALGRLGGASAQHWLFPLLTHTASEQGIPAGLPASATVVHKVGTMYGTEIDSAYVVTGRTTYVLSVAVDRLDEATGWSVIARVSARIWLYESGRSDFTAPILTPVGPSPRANRY